MLHQINQEPQVIFDEGTPQEWRTDVNTMVDLMPEDHQETVALLGAYGSAAELVTASEALVPTEPPRRSDEFLRAVAQVLYRQLDGYFGYDPATEAAARASSVKLEGDAKRLRRIATFATRRTLWKELQQPNRDNYVLDGSQAPPSVAQTQAA